MREVWGRRRRAYIQSRLEAVDDVLLSPVAPDPESLAVALGTLEAERGLLGLLVVVVSDAYPRQADQLAQPEAVCRVHLVVGGGQWGVLLSLGLTKGPAQIIQKISPLVLREVM